MQDDVQSIAQVIGKELGVDSAGLVAAIRLLDGGATVPFIARYRKEMTQGLSDAQLRHLTYRLDYLRTLNQRRTAILASIREQNQLTESLEQALNQAETKTRLEDLYLPYRPKRRTKAQTALDAGLASLAKRLLTDSENDPLTMATEFINPEADIKDAQEALEGARQILIEQFSEAPDLLAELRAYMWQHGVLTAKGTGQDTKKKFVDYADFSDLIRKIPSHRALALFRGRREQALKLALTTPEQLDIGEQTIIRHFHIDAAKASPWLKETIRLTWSKRLAAQLELDVFNRLREIADDAAIRVFANNLHDLLLASPAGSRVIMGLDPGIRTGVKVAVVDGTGQVLDYTTVFPLPPQSAWHEAIAELAKLASKYHVDLISVGNGTGSRDTERLVTELIQMYPDLPLTKVLVSEAGASVYSASALASAELPELDVTLRGAVSIARRLQDPLAELVKIEPKSIGVGQYQHDVNQARLGRCLHDVVETCVNEVGVDVNCASWTLLSYVSGLSEGLAKHIVQYRDEQGAFSSRDALRGVPRMGEKTFQQAIGFLRVRDSSNPLDASGIHPESYPIVEQMAGDLGISVAELLGQKNRLSELDLTRYLSDTVGLPTLQDILIELEKPGRDPRPVFKTVTFKDGVDNIDALEIGMQLEAVVTNVTHFGVFVDLGVHQDGLVHISEMTQRFVRDPREVVKAGDIIDVKVIEIDKPRKRIGLTMRLQEKPLIEKPSRKPPVKKAQRKPTAVAAQPSKIVKPMINSAMADAFLKLKRCTKTE